MFDWLGKLNRKHLWTARKSKSSRRARNRRLQVEYLENRSLPSIVVGPNINISRSLGNQNEESIAINPANPNQLFEASNDEASPLGIGLLAAFSNDGGVTWTRELIGGLAGPATVPPACCDPQVTYDQFGNLYLLYLDGSLSGADLLLSTDNGLTFNLLNNFAAAVDQPQMAVGPNSIWLGYTDGLGFTVNGATVTGLGAGSISAFTPDFELPGSDGANFGSIAVGPTGQVTAVYQNSLIGATSNQIRGNVNLTGVGGAWSQSIIITESNVLAVDKSIPANSNDMGTDAQVQVKYDLSSGPLSGRLYLIYSDAPSNNSSDVNVYVRVSGDDGIDWSGRIRVNDFDNGVASHFFPSLAVDPVTGFVAAEWYDTRNDQGHFLPGDTNGVPNDDAQLFMSASFDGGGTWARNVRVSTGTSNAARSEPAAVGLRPLGFGDYVHGYAFFNGVYYPVWADNSNSTRDNPDGTLNKMDVYTAQVLISASPGATPVSLVLGPTSPSSGGLSGGTGTGGISMVLGAGGIATANSFATSSLGTLGTGSRTAAALTGDLRGDGVADVATLDASTGQWWVSVPNGGTSVWGSWSPSANWTNMMVGDFNGDARADIVGRDAGTGQWWVSLSTGGSFVTASWGTWSTGATWVDMKVGDFNGDGKADIIGRYLQGGQWWVAQSNGAGFNTSLWATWSTGVIWANVQVTDFNHDGKADVTARALQSGQWWTSLSNGSGFNTSLWATWAPWINWTNVQVGDFNGDGLPDIIGRDPTSGIWWVGQSSGTAFTTSPWAVWSTGVTWVDVQVGDFNGDGKADITARALQSGQWWTAVSSGSSFATSLWAVWSTGVTWLDVQTTHLNGEDGFVAMAAQTGQWWMATPTVSAPVTPTGTQPITLGSPPPTTTTSGSGPISSVLGTH